MGKALDGVRVIDLTHAYNGPFAQCILLTTALRLLKLKTRAGDMTREWPPISNGESGYFGAINGIRRGLP